MMTKKTKAELALEAYLAGLTEKKAHVSDNRLIATNNRSEEWHNNRKKTFSSEKYRKNRKEQFNSPEVKANLTAGRQQMIENTDWLKNISEANRKNAKDPIALKNKTEANRKKAKDPKWIEAHKKAVENNKNPDSNYSKAIAKRTADKEWRNKNSAKNKLISSKQCVTPYGVFWSRIGAAKYIFENNLIPTRKTETSLMSFLVCKFKNNPKEYYYISIEEYIMLTGKDAV